MNSRVCFKKSTFASQVASKELILKNDRWDLGVRVKEGQVVAGSDVFDML